MRPTPISSVVAWIAQRNAEDLFLTAVNEAELRYEVAIAPAGRRKDELEAAMTRWLDTGFGEHILPFDSAPPEPVRRLPRAAAWRADPSARPTAGSLTYPASTAPSSLRGM